MTKGIQVRDPSTTLYFPGFSPPITSKGRWVHEICGSYLFSISNPDPTIFSQYSTCF